MKAGHRARACERQRPHQREVDLVGQRPPECERAATVEEIVAALDQRAAEEVEVVCDRLAERRAQ